MDVLPHLQSTGYGLAIRARVHGSEASVPPHDVLAFRLAGSAA